MKKQIVLASSLLASCIICSPVSSKTQSLSSIRTAYTAAPFHSIEGMKYFKGYEPTQTSVEPQPRVTDIILAIEYPLNLTAPEASLNHVNLVDPVVLPPSLGHPNRNAEVFTSGKNFSTAESLAALNSTISQISSIIKSSNSTGVNDGNCGRCVAALAISQVLVRDYPWEGSPLFIALCEKFTPTAAYGSCAQNYGLSGSGAQMTQVLSYANVTTNSLDAIMLCAKQLRFCKVPPPSVYDPNLFFNTTLPTKKFIAKPSGKRLKVLHLSDFHLDPRYSIGSEAQCDGYLCCQIGGNTSKSINFPSPRYGAFKCDTPYDLALAALEAIPHLTATVETGFDFSIFTGQSRAFVEYEETIIYSLLKKYLGGGPIYAALGNHDSYPQALNSLLSMTPDYIKDQFNWNYDHLASLWTQLGWINQDQAVIARTHYGGYSVKTKDGLRIISWNSDNIYSANLYNYINMTEIDQSGTLKWVAEELQRAEDNDERVWLVSHVLAGWDGSASLPNPSDLLQAITARYSANIAASFQGHIHDEVFYISYLNNGTIQDASTAAVSNWVGPSLTPLTNLNSGFRMYEVDSGSFDILDAFTWYSNVSTYAALDSQIEHGPSYHFEYSHREAYGKNITWGPNEPLNATWMHKVTEQMEIEPSLVNDFNHFQGRLSVLTRNCTNEICVEAKICYMRSATHALGSSCTPGYSSVQGYST